MVSLPDINTLVALAWPNHSFHRSAQDWYRASHSEGWATCSLTETGFIRVSSSRAATRYAKTPTEAVHLLSRMLELPGHVFWPDDRSLARSDELALENLNDPSQVIDAHLVLLSIARGGRLVTCDPELSRLVPEGHDRILTVLEP